jgi:hypothetical protein
MFLLMGSTPVKAGFSFEFSTGPFHMLDLRFNVVFMDMFNILSSGNHIVQGGHRRVQRGEETHLCYGG